MRGCSSFQLTSKSAPAASIVTATLCRLLVSYFQGCKFVLLFSLQPRYRLTFQMQWAPLNAITLGISCSENNSRLITFTEDMKIAVLLYIEEKAARVPKQKLISNPVAEIITCYRCGAVLYLLRKQCSFVCFMSFRSK